MKPVRENMRFNINLTEHCNLNCASCDHFSPVAAPKFADAEVYEKDLARLADLFGERLTRISLSGGEPLLHPQIVRFIELSRRYFPEAMLLLRTNGVLLPRMGADFWQACQNNRVSVSITNYPIKLNREGIESQAAEFGLKLDYTWDGKNKTMYKPVIDPEGQGDVDYNFKKCHRGNGCICLRDGRLFTCTLAPTAIHLNQHFNLNLEMSPNDSIDLHQAGSANEILDFLRRPIPFCRYCDMHVRIKGLAWKQSEGNLEEWLLTDAEKKKRDFWRRIRRIFGRP